MAGRAMQMSEGSHVGADNVDGAGTSTLSRQVDTAKSSLGPQVPSAVHRVVGSAGRPLDRKARAFFEPRFGRDFSQVRTHIGPDAASSAKQINARAYTVGSHIVFRDGAYDLDSRRGLSLLAHELAHVVQHSRSSQTGNTGSRIIARIPEGPDVGLTPSDPKPDLNPLSLHCGTYEDWVRSFLLIEPTMLSDATACFCLGAAVTDVVPIVGQTPGVEGVDCLCNFLSFLQNFYTFGAHGGCWSWDRVTEDDARRQGGFLGALIADCVSWLVGSQVGALIGAATGLGGGSGGGPVGAGGGGLTLAGLGALLGDAFVDVLAMMVQNSAQQGTIWPEAQGVACQRTWLRFQSQLRGE